MIREDPLHLLCSNFFKNLLRIRDFLFLLRIILKLDGYFLGQMNEIKFFIPLRSSKKFSNTLQQPIEWISYFSTIVFHISWCFPTLPRLIDKFCYFSMKDWQNSVFFHCSWLKNFTIFSRDLLANFADFFFFL